MIDARILQVCKALQFLNDRKVHYHSIQSENILIWTLDPLVVRLSDAGVMEKSHKCTVCCIYNHHMTLTFLYNHAGV